MTLAALVDQRDLPGRAVRNAVSRMRSSSVVKSIVERLEDLGVGEEGDRGARLLGQPGPPCSSPSGLPRSYSCGPREPVAADLDVEMLGQRVDDRDADAVQAAGDLVAATVAELAAGVQNGQHDLDGRALLLLHDRHRDAAAVVDDGDRVVGMDRDRERRRSGPRAPRRQSCRQPRRRDGAGRAAGRADVHAGPFADRLEALEDGDVLGVVGFGLGAAGGAVVSSPTILRLRRDAPVPRSSRRAGASETGVQKNSTASPVATSRVRTVCLQNAQNHGHVNGACQSGPRRRIAGG